MDATGNDEAPAHLDSEVAAAAELASRAEAAMNDAIADLRARLETGEITGPEYDVTMALAVAKLAELRTVMAAFVGPDAA